MLLKSLKGMVSSFTFYIIIGLAVALFSIGYLYKEQLKENGVQAQKITSLTTALETLNNQIVKERAEHISLQQKNKDISKDFNIVKKELLEYRGRQGTVAAKPTLVERKIQRSFDDFLTELGCETGDTSKCKK